MVVNNGRGELRQSPLEAAQAASHTTPAAQVPVKVEPQEPPPKTSQPTSSKLDESKGTEQSKSTEKFDKYYHRPAFISASYYMFLLGPTG